MLETKLGIDFGSANIAIYVENRGIVISEPSVVVCDRYSGKIMAQGEEADRMKEKLPASMQVIYPIKDGVVQDHKTALYLLKNYIDAACRGRLLRPSVLMSVSGNVTEIEKKALFDLVTAAGAGRACFIEESLAAAAGAGFDLKMPRGSMICDIGGGTTECAVLSMGKIVTSASARIGGNDLSKAITDYILHEHSILIGRATAEEIKKKVGTAVYRNEEVAMIAAGQHRDTSFPVLFEISSTEIYWVLKSYIEEILACIKSVLQQTPPELIADIAEDGLVICGGSAYLYGMEKHLEWNLGIRTFVADDAAECAAYGLGRLLKNMKELENNGFIFETADDGEDDA
ncbi:MAG: rod shape-determining protein [Clostridia bacterium]|nr:rod shape-determining protein [Clostridia bacterium]